MFAVELELRLGKLEAEIHAIAFADDDGKDRFDDGGQLLKHRTSAWRLCDPSAFSCSCPLCPLLHPPFVPLQ